MTSTDSKKFKHLLQSMVAIDAIKEEYISILGTSPFNISHWDTGNQYQSKISKIILIEEIEEIENIFNYEFSYTLRPELIEKVTRKLGIAKERLVHITPNGTSANVLALAMIKKKGLKKLGIFGPCYFQIPIIAQSLGIEIEILEAWNPIFGLDANKISNPSKFDAIWLTNPVYCFNNYYSFDSLEIIEYILSRNVVVIADECNSINGKELARKFSKYPNFIGTYAPHKGVCINGLKFGLVINGGIEKYELDYLSDCWIGPLSRNVIGDMNHFNSDNYDLICKIFNDEILKSEYFLNTYSKELPITIHHGMGHFRVISINGTPRELESNVEFFKSVIFKTGILYIPMIFNHSPGNLDFSFRINILANTAKIQETLPRLVSYISGKARK